MLSAIHLTRNWNNLALGLTILFAGLLVVSCGSSAGSTPTQEATSAPNATISPTPQPTSTSTPNPAEPEPSATPTASPFPTPESTASPTVGKTPQPTSTSTPNPAEPEPSATPTATRSPTPTVVFTPTPAFDTQRTIGESEGVTFLVGEGSEATFTVSEQLTILPLPSDAVMRTTALSGEIHLDGRPSVIKIDLQQLSSDQSRRDQYVRRRMFPNDPIAVFTLGDAGQPPEGFTSGEEITTQVVGEFSIRGIEVPLNFEIEARDDGDVIFILGRTSFVWSDFGLTAPTAVPIVISIEDEVKVEVLLVVRPILASEG